MASELDKFSKEFIKHMGKSLFSGLEESIPKMLAIIVEQKINSLSKALEPLQRIEEEQRMQGKDIENLQLSYKKMELELEKLRERSVDLPKDLAEVNRESISNAVAEAVPQAVNETFEVVGKKVKVEPKPQPFWKFW